MLVLDPDEVAVTDCADHAVDVLAANSVHDVIVLGRRGPAQAAFTTPELRELGELTRADIRVDPFEVDETELDSGAKRNLVVLEEYAQREPSGKERRVELRFLWSPVEILGEGDDGPVTGVRVVKNELVDGRAVPTGEEAVIACGLVFRSIGYRGVPLADIPWDDKRGLIRNEGGRVPGAPASTPSAGSSAALGRDRHQQEGRRRHRREDPRGPRRRCAERAAVIPEVPEGAVTWEGWRAIDEAETAAGEPQGRPRVKLVRVEHMLDAANGTKTP